MPAYRGELLEKRSRRELIGWVVLFPLVGLAMIVGAVVLAVKHGIEEEWFGLAWMLAVGTVIGIGLPGVALKELRRRKDTLQRE